LIHTDAVNCIARNGVKYDRVRILQEAGYWVEILSEAVSKEDLEDSQPYLTARIEEDVGIRDTLRFHAWNLITHDIVVMIDFCTATLQPMNEVFVDLLNDESKGMFIKSAVSQGVNTAMLFLKQSNEEFENL